MTWPAPEPGLVVRYSYLWYEEARQGRGEGVKDRPCAVVLAVDDGAENPRVVVLPITHSPPSDPSVAMEIPAATKMRLGLDAERSWVVLREYNVFRWPGPDLRMVVNGVPESAAYGVLPRRFTMEMLKRFAAYVRQGKTRQTSRGE